MNNLLSNVRVFEDGRWLTGDELTNALVAGAEYDRATGVKLKDGTRVFENDYGVIKLNDNLRRTTFMNSNLGKHMTEHGFEAVVVLVKSTDTLDVRCDCLFVRDGALVSSFDVGEYADPEDDEHARRIAERQAEDKLEPYTIPNGERQFLDYLACRELAIVGNSRENVGEVADLLAKFKATHVA